MSNTIKTLSDGAITRKALSILHNKLVFCKTINRQYDDRFARSGAKIGTALLIREPNQFAIREGRILDTQDVTETTQTLDLATQRGVDIDFTSVELTMSMDDFSERILEPAMARLAAELDKVVMTDLYKKVYNHRLGTGSIRRRSGCKDENCQRTCTGRQQITHFRITFHERSCQRKSSYLSSCYTTRNGME